VPFGLECRVDAASMDGFIREHDEKNQIHGVSSI
jgi:hypothetical protein